MPKSVVNIFIFIALLLSVQHNVLAAEKPKPQSEAQTINKLGALLEEASVKTSATPSPTPTEQTGACAYVGGSKLYCNNLSKSNCDRLGGTWTQGKCP